MATNYRTKQGDMLDGICWDFYGTTNVTDQVLEHNTHLAAHGVTYPAGLDIILPNLQISAPEIKTISLWD